MVSRSSHSPMVGPNRVSQHELLFRRLVARMPFDHCKRSLELVSGRMLHRRLVAGLHRVDVADSALIQFCHSLGMPASLLSQMQQDLPEAKLIHCVFEQGVETCSYMMQLEFGGGLDAWLKQPLTPPATYELRRAFKWTPDQFESGVVARYKLLPGSGLEATLRCVDRLFDRLQWRRTKDVLRELLHVIHNRLPKPWVVLQVTEDGHARLSYDVSCDGSRLRMRDIGPWLWQLADCYSILDVHATRELQPVRDCVVGHIEVGFDSCGADFVRIYHESEPNFGPGLDDDEL